MPTMNPMSNDTWTSPEFSWLTNASFQADYIFIKQGHVHFSGKWEDGEFKGYEFYGENSEFNGGTFHGTKYNAPNALFNVQKKINPEHYYTGIYTDNQQGILGEKNLDISSIRGIERFSLIEIPVGWGVELIDDYGKKIAFEVIKRLDEISTDFIFRIIPDRRKITIPWEIIRSDYFNKGFIIMGRPFRLFEDAGLDAIAKINVTTEPSMAISTRGIRLSSLPVEKLIKKYGGIDLTFDLSPKSEESKKFVSEFLGDISDGKFEDILLSLNAKVKNNQISGYGDFEFLSPIFNKVRGNDKLDAKTLQQLKYLNDVVGYVGSSVPKNIQEIIIKVLKKSLGVVSKRPKKPGEPESPDVSSVIGAASSSI
jgi:hypothetical protein